MDPNAPFSDPDDARAYLSSLSSHVFRLGDTSFLHPDFAVKMANAVAQARAAGAPVTVQSGYRPANETGSAYDAEGYSLHSYGAASDVGGIGSPGSPQAQQWAAIASKNGLFNPYGITNPREYNHWQLVPWTLENNSAAQKSIIAANGDINKIWNAVSPVQSAPMAYAGGQSGQSMASTKATADFLSSWKETPPASGANASAANKSDFLSSWAEPTPSPPASAAAPVVSGAGAAAIQPGANGLIWDANGGHDPKTGELVVGGKPLTPDVSHPQVLAGASGIVSGVPIVGPYLQGGLDRASAAIHTLSNGAPYADNLSAIQGRVANAQSEYPNTTTAGNVGGAIAGTIPAVAAAPGAFGIGGGPLLARVGASAGTNALIGATDAAVRSGADINATGQGAAIGAAAGAAGPVVGSIVGGASRLLGNATIRTLPAEEAALAARARQLGIPVNAGEMSPPNSFPKYATSALNQLPFSGYDPAAVQTGVNRAVSHTIGEDAGRITPDVMNAAQTRIGGMFDTVAARTTVKADPQFQTELMDTLISAQKELSDSEMKPLNAIFDNVTSKIDPAGNIDGATYQAITRNNTPLGRAIDSENPNISYWARSIKNSLDDALQRSAPPDVQDMLTTARRQWAALKTVEPLAAKAPTGDINPVLLAGKVNVATGNGLAYGRGGDLGDIARIGQRFLKEPPNSGTAMRNFIYGGLGAAAGAVGLNEAGVGPPMSPGMATGALALPAALLAGRFAGGALRSPWLANALINRSLNPGVGSVIPGLAGGAAAAFTPARNALLGATQ